MRFNAGFVLNTLTAYQPTGDEREVSTVVIDSREAVRDCMFIAFPGEQVDGHDFVGEAIQHGAIIALVERPLDTDGLVIDARHHWDEHHVDGTLPNRPICIIVNSTLQALQKLARAWRAQFDSLRVIGITGSVGKTTTKELVHSVLSTKFRTLKSQGNYNNEIGLPLTVLNARSQHERMVLEMGMYTSGEISLLCDIARPHVGIVTIVGSVHMEWLGSIDAIAKAKQELVEYLPPSPEGVAILNADDPRVLAMADHTTADIFTYGLNSQSDIWADEIHSMGLEGIRFVLNHRNDRLHVHVPLLGRHSVHTSLRAAAVGLKEGLSWDEIISGLQGLTSQLRLVAVPGPAGSVILDDTYNSSPESAIAALNLLADLKGRRVAVLGDMLELGPVEESSHQLVGRRASDVADILLAVGALGQLIGEAALAAGMKEDQVRFAADAEAAIPILEKVIRSSDMVLVKGSRGANLDQIVSALGRD